ncbi:MAG: lipase family alpha/beta hydrolase [Candidatus Binatia bacterium]
MTKPAAHLHPRDLHGLARLATDATSAVTDVVEAMQAAIVGWPSFTKSVSRDSRLGGVAGLPFAGVRTVARLLGSGLDLALPPLVARVGERNSTPERDTLLSVVNGVVGDHLADTGNPLAVRMELRRCGRALELRKEALAAALPRVSPRLAVMLHGLCGSDGQWKRRAVDYGASLERDFGFTPLYLRYNSGRHISRNGSELAGLLEVLVEEWPLPVEELLLFGHSMGALVARSALHYGAEFEHAWPLRVRRAVFLGAPHHGAPLERGGNWFEETLGSVPYAAPLSRLGRLRSAGITDLRHGNLVDEDWQGRDRFAPSGDSRRPLPLPAGLDCIAIAATTGRALGDIRDRFVGDGLVPVASALGHHPDPSRRLAIDEARQHVLAGAHHMDLLGHPVAWAHLSNWLSS